MSKNHPPRPDAQVAMANERTFLAWVRTALALVAGAVAVQTPAVDLDVWVKTVASLWLLGTAGFAIVQSWTRWRATERALLSDDPIPGFGGAAVLATLLGVLIVAVAVGVVVVAVR